MTSAALTDVSGQLSPAAPFDFAQTLAFVDMFTPARGEQTTDGGALTKAIMVGGQPIIVRVTDAGSETEPKLDYTLYAQQPIDEATQAQARDRISFYLSLNDDLRHFYAAAESDQPFWPLVQRLYGYHQVKFATPFENACWAILGQRQPMNIARKMKQQLIERYGASLQFNGRTYWAFPQAAQMSTDATELEAVISHHQKAPYLAAAAQAFRDVDEGWLRQGDYDEVMTWLRGIKGIGEWSAHFVLVRGLGRMARLQYTQEELLKAASRIYLQTITPADLARLAEHYGDDQGYWALYLRATS